jgi:HEAT repeat protein
MIDSSVDQKGHSLRHLVWKGLKTYPTPSLFQFLEDGDVIVRTAVARELQLRGGGAVFKRALLLLSNKKSVLREIGAFLLGQLGTPKRPYKKRSTGLLLKALEAEMSPSVRATIIASVGLLKATTAVKRCVKYAGDRSPLVRGSVAFAIGSAYFGRRKAMSPALHRVLRRLHSDKSKYVREFAQLGIELLTDK